MWTKRYIFKPSKEEYFKSKHPVACVAMLLPMILYTLIIQFAKNSWWIMVGFGGSLIFGIGLAYAFAVKVKIYEKVLLPIFCLAVGAVLITASLFRLF